MNRTTTYLNLQPCPYCKDTDRPCTHCGRVRMQGQVTITVTTSELNDTLLKLLDRKKA